ncbi:MAG TPA: cyclic nucleotide-binding domain-containing protein, partial [Polyangiaceae bacterium]|nr:cyclic nucleotide-binding domain-containing protein [Polyangiaceae bacterium]
ALAKAIAACRMILDLDPQHTETQARLAALQAQGNTLAPARTLGLPKAPGPPLPSLRASPPRVPTQDPPHARSRPDLAQVLRQRRAAQGPPTSHGAPRATPERAPGPPTPSIPLPFLADAPLNEVVPGSKPVPSSRGVPSGMFRIEVEELLPPEPPHSADAPDPADRAERTARKALPVTPLFSELGPASLERLIGGAELHQLDTGDVLYRRGEPAGALYVVASGAVSLIADGETRVAVTRVVESEFFGEAALMCNEPRQETAEALEPTEVLAVDLATIRALITEEPRALPTVLRFLRERLVESSILTNRLFTALSRLERRKLAARFDFLELEPGALAIWQGVRSPGLFVLLAGTVEVRRDDGTEERLLATLGSGAVFGEMSLLGETTAVADVRSLTRSFALMLPRAEFKRVCDLHPPVLEFIRELTEARTRANELDEPLPPAP